MSAITTMTAGVRLALLASLVVGVCGAALTALGGPTETDGIESPPVSDLGSGGRRSPDRGPVFMPVPAPATDNSWIAYDALGEDGSSRLFVVAPDGADSRQIGQLTLADADWAWSDSGRELVFCHRVPRMRLGRWDSCLESGRVPRLSPPSRSALTFLDTTPRLSPDGSMLALVRVHDAAPRSAALVVLDLATDRSSMLVGFGDFVGMEIDWSPDSRWLAYTAAPGEDAARDLWIVRADGSQQRQLTRLPQGDAVSNPSYSPDGTRIAAGVRGAGGDEIAVADLVDGELTRIAGPADVRLRALKWGPVVG